MTTNEDLQLLIVNLQETFANFASNTGQSLGHIVKRLENIENRLNRLELKSTESVKSSDPIQQETRGINDGQTLTNSNTIKGDSVQFSALADKAQATIATTNIEKKVQPSSTRKNFKPIAASSGISSTPKSTATVLTPDAGSALKKSNRKRNKRQDNQGTPIIDLKLRELLSVSDKDSKGTWFTFEQMSSLEMTAIEFANVPNPEDKLALVAYIESCHHDCQFACASGIKSILNVIPCINLDTNGIEDILNTFRGRHMTRNLDALRSMFASVNLNELYVHGIAIGIPHMPKTPVLVAEANWPTVHLLAAVVNSHIDDAYRSASRSHCLKLKAPNTKLYISTGDEQIFKMEKEISDRLIHVQNVIEVAALNKEEMKLVKQEKVQLDERMTTLQVQKNLSELTSLAVSHGGFKGSTSLIAEQKHGVHRLKLVMDAKKRKELIESVSDERFQPLVIKCYGEIATRPLNSNLFFHNLIKKHILDNTYTYITIFNLDECLGLAAILLALFRLTTKTYYGVIIADNLVEIYKELDKLFAKMRHKYRGFGPVELLGEVKSVDDILNAQHLFKQMLVADYLITGINVNKCKIVFSDSKQFLASAKKVFRISQDGVEVFDYVCKATEHPNFTPGRPWITYDSKGKKVTSMPTGFTPLSFDYDWQKPQDYQHETPEFVCARNAKLSSKLTAPLPVCYSYGSL